MKVSFRKIKTAPDPDTGAKVRHYEVTVRYADESGKHMTLVAGQVWNEPYETYSQMKWENVIRYDWRWTNARGFTSERRGAAYRLLIQRMDEGLLPKDQEQGIREALYPTRHSAVRTDVVKPDGSSTEEGNDCVVAAINRVTDLPYWKCHTVLQKIAQGRRPNTGYYPSWYRRAIRELGFSLVPIASADLKVQQPYRPEGQLDEMTSARFAREFPKGRYFIASRTHAMAVIDGRVYGGGRYKISVAYEIVPLPKEAKQ